jgi:hypothetical protein
MDVYDTGHRPNYDFILHVHNNSNATRTIEDFLEQNGINKTKELIDRISSLVNSYRSGMKMMDDRHLTLIGGRIYTEEGKWILVNVCRG